MKQMKFSEIKEVCEIIGCTATELPELLEEDWLLLTDSEADLYCKDRIEESVWAFNPEFLAEITDLDVDVIKSIQDNNKCEDNNDVFLKLIEASCGLDAFVETAISWDGRGHFIGSYDGAEYEIGDLYLYRLN